MYYINRIVAICLFVYSTVCNAYQTTPREMPVEIYDAVVLPLLSDLSQILNTDVPEEKPKISLAPAEELRSAHCKDQGPCSVAAITDRNTGEIVLHQGFIPNNLLAVSILFHELVHWVQIKKHWFSELPDCQRWARQEMQAYRAQSQWLQQHGHPGFLVPNLALQCSQ